ncbi:alpha-methyl-mannoside-specific lectin-like [Juglans microcarpa x Juglans regia]|uniref:alpha-methyl-mannoside-specific lectin-like n=1 Tax=Juglans microcarpa x Juglans regia TaxID=2249226 RepID=UPI001B7DE4D5|nr:alpha-methyl-mannoside-specific lectin-like [Juglans microcarpa x Juglans regia]
MEPRHLLAGHFLIRFDVAVRAKGSVIAAICWNDSGEAIYAIIDFICSVNPNIGEAKTALMAVIKAKRLGKDRYSDGITFFLASPDFPPPRPTDGAGIGLVSRDQARDSSFLDANKFVAVEFDTFRNDELDPPEPVHEHVGININSIRSQNSTPWSSVIKENRTYSASISYDSAAQNLSVTFTGFSNGIIPIQQHLSSIVDLRDYLPERVEFGFSSSTGLLSELHILRSWSFESTPP